MKIKSSTYAIVLLIFAAFFHSNTVFADDLLEKTQKAGFEIAETDLPETAIVIEATHGQILWEQNSEQTIDVAELSNLMTIYLTLEAIQSGTISMDTKVTATANHEAISRLEMKNKPVYAGVEYTVKDIIRMALVPSANAASVMLSNLLAEEDGDFVTQMNSKASELEMTATTFNTATGIPAISFEGYYQPEGFDMYAGNQTTAKDLANLTYHLVKDFPTILDLSKELTFTILPDSLYEETVKSDNESLPTETYAFKGMDGLKTASSYENGFHFIGTAKQNGLQLITVLTGVGDSWNLESKNVLFQVNNTLMNEMFNNYQYQEILAAGVQTINDEEINVEKDFYGVVKVGETPSFIASNGVVEWMSHLPLVASTGNPTTVNYKEVSSISEEEALNYKFLTFLIDVVEITKTSIIALAMLLLGLVFALMAVFIPRPKAPVVPEVYERTSRSERPPKDRVLPMKWLVLSTGVALFLIGTSMLVIQYITNHR